MPLWKTSSTAARSRASKTKSIRGTISAPIPIPSSFNEDEFPIRSTGSGIATSNADDEFPIRKPGTGIASPVPPEDEADLSTDQLPAPEQAQVTEEEPRTQPEPRQESESERDDEVEAERAEPELPLPSDLSSGVEAGAASGADVSESSSPDATPAQAIPEHPIDPPPPPPESSSPTERDSRPIPPPAEPLGVASQRQFSLSGSYPPKEQVSQELPPRRSTPPRSSLLRSSPPRRSSPSRRSSPPRASAPAPVRKANPASTFRYSTVSEAPSGHTNQSRDRGPPSRKKSTLRSTFSRLFGRKKKKTSESVETNRASAHISEIHSSPTHHSDPTALRRVTESEPQRSASLPITEFNRPLRSHSIGPDDILAIESARNSLQTDSRPVRRRAATAASRSYLQPRRDAEWGRGLSPRPASSHDRSTRVMPGQEDPSEIGRAVTSDSDKTHRRRSRSLSGLSDVAITRGTVRRRSVEIRYWRESYDPGFMSPLSSNAAEDNELAGGFEAEPESPVADRPPKTPPQPFNFGLISNDMIGMKITQAASMDMRIGGLESRTYQIERVVDQLCHSVPGFKSPLKMDLLNRGESSQTGPGAAIQPGFAYTSAVPPAIPAIYQGLSGDLKRSSRYSSSRHSVETDAHSQISFGDAPTYIGSLHPPSSSATQPQSLTVAAPAGHRPIDRPASNSTVRGATSLPTMGRDMSEAGSQRAAESYSILLTQLEAERAARQALEAQVKKLSDRVNSLSATMFAMVGGPAKSRSQERLAPPPSDPAMPTLPGSENGLQGPSVFETSDDEQEKNTKKRTERRRDEDEKTDDEYLTEDFQTPHEERTPQMYGAFGEELREDYDAVGEDEDDPKRRKAARTLSLSQLTLKKAVRTRI